MTMMLPLRRAERFAAVPVLASALLFAASLPALAFDSGGSQTTRSCPTGQVWSDQAKKCVVAKSALECGASMAWSESRGRCLPLSSGEMGDEELVEEGRLLARAGYYEKAIAVLSAVARPHDAVALTYLGYSHRKLGRLDLANLYYLKALSADPDNVDAREYLGESYLAAGRIDLAQAELAEIEARCGTACEQYRELRKLIGTAGGA